MPLYAIILPSSKQELRRVSFSALEAYILVIMCQLNFQDTVEIIRYPYILKNDLSLSKLNETLLE